MFGLLRYLKGYRAAAIAAPLFKIIEAIIELIVPLIVAAMIDGPIARGDIPAVIGMGALMAGLSCVGLGFSLACQYLASKAAVGLGCNIRTALYAHLHRLNLGDSDRMGTGALVNRLSTDVAQAQQGFAMFLRLMLRAPVIAAGGAIMSIIVAPSLWYIGVGAGVLAFVITYPQVFVRGDRPLSVAAAPRPLSPHLRPPFPVLCPHPRLSSFVRLCCPHFLCRMDASNELLLQNGR